jgi:hypothetical protein
MKLNNINLYSIIMMIVVIKVVHKCILHKEVKLLILNDKIFGFST